MVFPPFFLSLPAASEALNYVIFLRVAAEILGGRFMGSSWGNSVATGSQLFFQKLDLTKTHRFCRRRFFHEKSMFFFFFFFLYMNF